MTGMRSVIETRSGTAGKLERIQQLADHGLNTPRLIQIAVGTRFDDKLRSRLRKEAGREPLMTVRTYHPTDETTYAKGPFFPEIPVNEAIQRAEELSHEWNVLYQEAIDVGETLLAGNVILRPDGGGSYEALEGRYRVRDIEHPPVEAKHLFRHGTFYSTAGVAEPKIREAVELVRASGLLADLNLADDEAVVIEFNIQRGPVGRLRDSILLWEWRPLLWSHTRSADEYDPGQRRTGRVYGIGLLELSQPPSTAAYSTVLGGKGFSLWAMAQAGLPVPPAILLSVPPKQEHGITREWDKALDTGLRDLREISGHRRVSVRSSPTVSMPGMLKTVLDVDSNVSAVRSAIEVVLDSWRSDRAIAYRRNRGISEFAGLAVVIEAMVYGNRDGLSGSGVGFSRNPLTGEPEPIIEYAEQATGEEIVGGRRTPLNTDEFRSRYLHLWESAVGAASELERLFRDMQEFEFTIESGTFYLLQSRPGKRSSAARVRIAHDLAAAGVISDEKARDLLASLDLGRLVQLRLDASGHQPLAVARVAAPGAVVGRLALGRRTIAELRSSGEAVIYCSRTTDPSDYPLMKDLAGIVTRHGGVTSHAAVAALEAGIVALVGCDSLEIDDRQKTARFGTFEVSEGDWLSIEGSAEGRIYAGRLAERPDVLPAGLNPKLLLWARETLGGQQRQVSSPIPTPNDR
jgi:pyruvate,orthophosphate dikinase